MDRVINIDYNGRPLEAYCPAAAIFDIYEKFGQVGNVAEISHFDENTRDGWNACCWILAELCRWGELRRRHLGEEPRDMVTVSELLLAPPADVPRLRLAAMQAIEAGFRRDIPDEARERDLVLEEIQAAQKKTPPAGGFGRSIWPWRRESSSGSRARP